MSFILVRRRTRCAAAMEANGGLITLDDLKNYKAVERMPLTGKYRNYTIITAPPPSGGGLGILQMLAMLEGTGYEKGGFGSASALHYEAEVMRRFYADRAQYLGDPDFVKNPIAGLLDPAYIASRRASIDPATRRPVVSWAPASRRAPRVPKRRTSTWSMSRKRVSVTFTLNGGYGNGITVPGLGFLLEQRDGRFHIESGCAEPVRPGAGQGKHDCSRETPAFVDGADDRAAGRQALCRSRRTGGSRIPSAILQAFVDVVDFGMNPQDAVDAGFITSGCRIGSPWSKGISPDTLDALKALGHEVHYEPGR